VRLPPRLLNPRVARLVYAATITVVCGGLGWVTATALAVEAAERSARAASEVAGKERLALWRLDGQLFPVVAVENGRPFADFTPGHPSPLTTAEYPEWMSLHFQLDAETGWTSPQVTDNGPPTRRHLLESLRNDFPAAEAVVTLQPRDGTNPVAPARAADAVPPPQNAMPLTQALAPGNEYENRRQARTNTDNYANAGNNAIALAPAPAAAHAKSMMRAAPQAPNSVQVGPVRPAWLSGKDGKSALALVRTVRLDDRTVFQGVLLDWPKLRDSLLAQVADLFPAATLTPIRTPTPATPELTMTALPAQLDPGASLPPPPTGTTPLRLALGIAWAVVLLAIAAVGLGGHALLDLSERRIRFVAAVTHELRTPLTTLRLYLDLLHSGMVSDEATRAEYVGILAAEADRLHRLVENVLDFARLENRKPAAELRPVPVADVLAATESEWAGRCRESGKKLVVHSLVAADASVTADAGVLGQVLGILIDNARKYSRDATDSRVWLRATPAERGRVAFEVEDRGPGVPSAERAAVFEPFRRGLTADVAAGGAGLGLSLARHWATQLRGRLTCRDAAGGGAVFRLTLDAA
jgi:signal transduction histidine kinase